MVRPEPERVIDLEQTHTDLSSAPALSRERVRLINLPQVCKVLDRYGGNRQTDAEKIKL